MKKMSVAQKMRWAAGGVYVLLFIYQIFSTQYHLNAITLTQAYLPWMYTMAVIPAAGAMAIWMFAGKRVLPGGARRAVLLGTALFIIFELFTYDMQAVVITTTFYYYLPGLYNQTIWVYFFVIFRLLLMILSAFFVAQSNPTMDYLPGKKPQDMTRTVLEVDLPKDEAETKADKVDAAKKDASTPEMPALDEADAGSEAGEVAAAEKDAAKEDAE